MGDETFPEWLEPMAATLTDERFADPNWIFERKLDGIRLLAYKNGDEVALFSRNRLPQRLTAIQAAVGALPPSQLVLDGEMTWDGGEYHIFDILFIDGRLVTTLPLEERQELLATLPLRPPLERVPTIDQDQPWELACREGWEGVIA